MAQGPCAASDGTTARLIAQPKLFIPGEMQCNWRLITPAVAVDLGHRQIDLPTLANLFVNHERLQYIPIPRPSYLVIDNRRLAREFKSKPGRESWQHIHVIVSNQEGCETGFGCSSIPGPGLDHWIILARRFPIIRRTRPSYYSPQPSIKYLRVASLFPFIDAFRWSRR